MMIPLSNCCKCLAIPTRKELPKFLKWFPLLRCLLPVKYICTKCEHEGARLVKGNEYRNRHYVINYDLEKGLTITHLLCNVVSDHPTDVKEKYCHNCHIFLEDLEYYFNAFNPKLYDYMFNFEADINNLLKYQRMFCTAWINCRYSECHTSLTNLQHSVSHLVATFEQCTKLFNLEENLNDG
jgi:hypothetical protein